MRGVNASGVIQDAWVIDEGDWGACAGPRA